jgi:hypothetical protein
VLLQVLSDTSLASAYRLIQKEQNTFSESSNAFYPTCKPNPLDSDENCLIQSNLNGFVRGISDEYLQPVELMSMLFLVQV